MKKLCVLLAALAISTGAFAQKMWMGGALAGTIEKSRNSFYFAPEFGYFLADNISLEGSIGWGQTSDLTNILFNVTGRYWFSVNDDINYNPGVCLQVNHGIAEVLGDKYSNTGVDILFQLGSFDYAVADDWSVRLTFCQLSLNSLFDNPNAEFSVKIESAVTIKYYF